MKGIGQNIKIEKSKSCRKENLEFFPLLINPTNPEIYI